MLRDPSARSTRPGSVGLECAKMPSSSPPRATSVQRSGAAILGSRQAWPSGSKNCAGLSPQNASAKWSSPSRVASAGARVPGCGAAASSTAVSVSRRRRSRSRASRSRRLAARATTPSSTVARAMRDHDDRGGTCVNAMIRSPVTQAAAAISAHRSSRVRDQSRRVSSTSPAMIKPTAITWSWRAASGECRSTSVLWEQSRQQSTS